MNTAVRQQGPRPEQGNRLLKIGLDSVTTRGPNRDKGDVLRVVVGEEGWVCVRACVCVCSSNLLMKSIITMIHRCYSQNPQTEMKALREKSGLPPGKKVSDF